jgi:hypothetical protein
LIVQDIKPLEGYISVTLQSMLAEDLNRFVTKRLPKREEVTGEWRKLHNGELHNLYQQPGTMRWAGHVARMGEGIKVYEVLTGKPEGKRPLGRPKRRCEDGIKMDLIQIGWGRGGGVEWIHRALGRDRWRAVVNAVMTLRVLAPRS